jgi:hypothetical protein
MGALAQNDIRAFLTLRERKWECQVLLDTWIWRPGRSSLELSTPDSTHPLTTPKSSAINCKPSTSSTVGLSTFQAEPDLLNKTAEQLQNVHCIVTCTWQLYKLYAVWIETFLQSLNVFLKAFVFHWIIVICILFFGGGGVGCITITLPVFRKCLQPSRCYASKMYWDVLDGFIVPN